jgi:hypothetical protein
MKKNRLAFILILVLFGFAALLIWQNQSKSTLSNKETAFAVSDTASITKIFIADLDTADVLLERTAQGWIANKAYKAHNRKVDLLLETMMKLRVRSPVSVASHDNVVKRMAGISVKVEVYQMVHRINLFNSIKLFPREKRTKVYYVGDATKDNMGTFMLMEGAPNAYIVYIVGFRGFVASRYSPLLDNWRDYSVFKKRLADIKSVRVEFNREPEQSFTIETVERLNYQITRLKDGSVVPGFDTLRALNFLTSFADLRFEALLKNQMPAARIDSIVNSPFLHRITLIDKAGDTTQLTTFEKRLDYDHLVVDDFMDIPVDVDRLYGLTHNNKDFVLLQYFVFDKVLRPLSYFEEDSSDDLLFY